MKPEKLLYKVIQIENGVVCYDCCLCGNTYLNREGMEEHLKHHKRLEKVPVENRREGKR